MPYGRVEIADSPEDSWNHCSTENVVRRKGVYRKHEPDIPILTSRRLFLSVLVNTPLCDD